MAAGLAYSTFTPDGRSVLGFSASMHGIHRFSLERRRLERFGDLGSILLIAPAFVPNWMGLDPEDAPVIVRDASRYDLFALE